MFRSTRASRTPGFSRITRSSESASSASSKFTGPRIDVISMRMPSRTKAWSSAIRTVVSGRGVKEEGKMVFMGFQDVAAAPRRTSKAVSIKMVSSKSAGEVCQNKAIRTIRFLRFYRKSCRRGPMACPSPHTTGKRPAAHFLLLPEDSKVFRGHPLRVTPLCLQRMPCLHRVQIPPPSWRATPRRNSGLYPCQAVMAIPETCKDVLPPVKRHAAT